MGLTRRFLVALFPKKWRELFGDEFAALLDETDLSPASVIDVVGQAGKLHVRAHRLLMSTAGALAISTCFEIVCLRTGITANILWAPTNPIRAIALIATVGPWLALAGDALYRRHRRDDHPLPQITQQ